MSHHRLLLSGLACVFLAACSNVTVPRIVTEYRIDIQQGNVLSQEAIAQLKPGQTREQVRFILGTPLLTDMFHAQRWDYVYRFQNGRTNAVESRKFSVYFNQDNRLERVAGDVEVAEVSELLAPVAKTRVIDLGTLPADAEGQPLPVPQERGFFGKMLEKVGL